MTIQKLDQTPKQLDLLIPVLQQPQFDIAYNHMYTHSRVGVITQLWNQFLLWAFGTRFGGEHLSAAAAARPAELASIRKLNTALKDLESQLARTPIVDAREAAQLHVTAAQPTGANLHAAEQLRTKQIAFYEALKERVELIAGKDLSDGNAPSQLGLRTPTLDNHAGLYQAGLRLLANTVKEHNRTSSSSAYIAPGRVTFMSQEIFPEIAIDSTIRHLTPRSVVERGSAVLEEQSKLYVRTFGDDHYTQRTFKQTVRSEIIANPDLARKHEAFRAVMQDCTSDESLRATTEKSRHNLSFQLNLARAELAQHENSKHALDQQIGLDRGTLESTRDTLSSSLEELCEIIAIFPEYDDQDIFSYKGILHLTDELNPNPLQLFHVLALEERLKASTDNVAQAQLNPLISRAKQLLERCNSLSDKIEAGQQQLQQAQQSDKPRELQAAILELQQALANVERTAFDANVKVAEELSQFVSFEPYRAPQYRVPVRSAPAEAEHPIGNPHDLDGTRTVREDDEILEDFKERRTATTPTIDLEFELPV